MLEGDISEIRLVERLVELWREQFTGAIRFESDGIIKIVYFKGGDILSASTNDRGDSIDEILMKAGKVSREHVKQALAKRKENETLGDALLNLGFITRKELTWARRVQVVGVIRSIAAWTSGSFTIVADYLPKRDEGTLFPLPQVLVELIVTDQDRQQFERAMDGGNATFAKAADFDDVFRRLGLNEDAEAIAREIDGSQSAAEVATSSGRDTFNAYKLIHALATLGIIHRVEKPREQPQFSLDDFASAGVADAADMWNEPEAAAAPEPMFQLDEAEALKQPTLEVPLQPMSFEPEPVAPAPSTSAWDEPEEEISAPIPAPEPVAGSKMPAWDTPPREPAAIPIPARIEPPAEPAEEQWGFDEAQIETARRAAVPVAAAAAASAPTVTPAPKGAKPAKVREGKGGRFGLILALLVIAILAGAGYYGWLWWQGRQAEEEAARVAAARPITRPRKTTPPPTGTAAPATETTATTVATNTATLPPVAPARAPLQVTATSPATAPTPVPTPAPSTPTPPPAAPANASRERYDALAREYAANPSGNFTVQIQILCDPSNLGKAVAAGGANVWFVPQPIGARSCYRVFYGRYTTREEAQRALADVPASIRDRSAAVKAVPR
jgi:hypothetical protein